MLDEILSHCLFCGKREDVVEYMIKPECEPLVRVYPLGVCGICADACASSLGIMKHKKPEKKPEDPSKLVMGRLGVGEVEVC